MVEILPVSEFQAIPNQVSFLVGVGLEFCSFNNNPRPIRTRETRSTRIEPGLAIRPDEQIIHIRNDIYVLQMYLARGYLINKVSTIGYDVKPNERILNMYSLLWQVKTRYLRKWHIIGTWKYTSLIYMGN